MLTAAGWRAEARVLPLGFERGSANGAYSYHWLMPRRQRIFRSERPTSDRVLEFIGGSVILLVVAVAIYAAFTMSNLVGVSGLLILVVVVGLLFSRRFG